MEGNSAGMALGNGSASGLGGSSSDFVRKLFKMLEDPSHRQVVRWNDAGDSFIVVDTNEFTRNILPNHFKHSNFASFVRQLNKYDFHKIRNNEEGSSNSYGHQTWEFKHPDFQIHNIDNLDNIKRKAPAPRKPTTQQGEDAGVEELNNQVRELSKQNHNITAQVQRLTSDNHAVIQEVNSMQLALQQHENRIHLQEMVIHNLMAYLRKLDDEINGLRTDRDQDEPLRTSSQGHDEKTPRPLTPENAGGSSSRTRERLSTPLQRAQVLLSNNLEANPSLMRLTKIPQPSGQSDAYADFERLAQSGQRSGSSPSNGGAGFPASSTTGSFQNGYTMHPPHNGTVLRGRPHPPRKRSTPFVPPNWQTPPRILLVEDDATCARIGSKFLQTAECNVDLASDGLIAVTKLNTGKYDLVLMDIVMPSLDGVSAAALVRQFDTETPIIAMTSNIRRDDINMYFNNGMNDVLPKPFTKEGLLNMLEKYLSHLKGEKDSRIPPQPGFLDRNNGIIQGHRNAIARGGAKYSQSPSKSPRDSGIYGRAPVNPAESAVRQTPPPIGDENAYVNLLGGLLNDSVPPRNTASIFSSPGSSSAGVRRPASEMDDNQHFTGIDAKKPRY